METSPAVNRPFKALICLLIMVMAAAAVSPVRAERPPLQSPALDHSRAQIREFEQTNPGVGWLLLGDRLYRTEDEGAHWADITPGGDGGLHVQNVAFLNDAQGWAIAAAGGAGSYTLAQTQNGGASWSIQPVELTSLGDLPGGIAAVYMGWLDAHTGWLVLKLATGSNFSIGRLFITLDGGETWQPREIPLGEPVRFISAAVGWVAGGPAGDQLFRTTDGGLTWTPQSPAHDAGEAAYSLPAFSDESRGLLPVVVDQKVIAFYSSADGGETWSLLGRQPLGAESVPEAGLPLAVLDASNALVIPPGGSRTIQMRGGKLAPRDSAQADPGGIVSLSMSSMEAGWAKREMADCQAISGWACTREVQLLSTRDGGAHWRAIELPGGSGERLTETFALGAKNVPSGAMAEGNDPDTQPYIGHGFDACQIPSLAQMQTWWNRSPYSAVNLYIGGSARACSNAALSASYISSLHSQGWRFIPTWVGPQAACSWFSSRMSWDPATAYEQGVTQANQALNTALDLGLTAPDKSGTVIYYDLEAYNVGDSGCRAAANAFISGWVNRMHERGSLGAVYGASCGSAPTDWSTIPDVPDALWVANWYGNAGEVTFDRTATVWGNYCLSDSLWSNHQRLRQYAGGHDETWGGQTLNIDSNVLDGPVTVPDGRAGLLKPSRPQLLSPMNGATLLRSSKTWLAWKTTGDTCSVHVWGGSGLNITAQADCSQFRLGVRPGGAYSWQVTAKNALGSTIGPIWRLNIRPFAVTGMHAEAVSASSVRITWRLSADEPSNVDTYAIYADGGPAGTAGKGTTSFLIQNLACGRLHSFQVRAVRQGVKSLPAAASAATPSCAPALISPPEGSVTTTLRPRFDWDPVPDAASYQLQVSALPDFSSLLLDQALSGTAYAPTSDLPADSVLYWRARAAAPFSGDWSPAVSFRTANPPSVPALITPLAGEVLADYTPRLDWTDSSLPEGTSLRYYQVRVAVNSKFTAPLYNKWTLASEFTIPADLPPDGTYYWQVRAMNNLGQFSTWSAKRIFKTAP